MLRRGSGPAAGPRRRAPMPGGTRVGRAVRQGGRTTQRRSGRAAQRVKRSVTPNEKVRPPTPSGGRG